MSKKIINTLILTLLAAGAITVLFFLLKDRAVESISNESARKTTAAVLWVLYAAVDFFLVIRFLYYWWCDRKWTKIKKWAKRKFGIK